MNSTRTSGGNSVKAVVLTLFLGIAVSLASFYLGSTLGFAWTFLIPGLMLAGVVGAFANIVRNEPDTATTTKAGGASFAEIGVVLVIGAVIFFVFFA